MSVHVPPKTVAIIGSGPAGLVAAWALQNGGYKVTVFEKVRKNRQEKWHH